MALERIAYSANVYNFVLGGIQLEIVTNLTFTKTRDVKYTYGFNNKAVEVGYGQFAYAGSFECPRSEIESYLTSIGNLDILSLSPMEANITLTPVSLTGIVIYKLSGLVITNISSAVSDGDTNTMVQVDFMYADETRG